MNNLAIFFTTVILILGLSFPSFSRCAVCYTNGLSGASIAVIVIVSSFLLLFIGNKLLQKILSKI